MNVGPTLKANAKPEDLDLMREQIAAVNARPDVLVLRIETRGLHSAAASISERSAVATPASASKRWPTRWKRRGPSPSL